MRSRRMMTLVLLSIAVSVPVAQLNAIERDRLRVQRKEIFEFTEKPVATARGDNVTTAFAVKDYCDVTVAIEDLPARPGMAAGLPGNEVVE
jgi:hypothetical protein